MRIFRPRHQKRQGAHCVDDIGIVATSPKQLISNLRAVFKRIQNAGLEPPMAKRLSGTKENDFFGESITSHCVTRQKQKITKNLEKNKFLRSKGALQRYFRFLNYYQN